MHPRDRGVLGTPCWGHPGLTMALTTLPMYTGSLRREQSLLWSRRCLGFMSSMLRQMAKMSSSNWCRAGRKGCVRAPQGLCHPCPPSLARCDAPASRTAGYRVTPPQGEVRKRPHSSEVIGWVCFNTAPGTRGSLLQKTCELSVALSLVCFRLQVHSCIFTTYLCFRL